MGYFVSIEEDEKTSPGNVVIAIHGGNTDEANRAIMGLIKDVLEKITAEEDEMYYWGNWIIDEYEEDVWELYFDELEGGES